MALRILNKINRNRILNLGKVFYSGKPVANPIHNVPETATKDFRTQKNKIYGTHSPSCIQKAQVSSAEMMSTEAEHLQPSKLNEYYQNPLDIGAGTFPNLPDSNLEQSKGGSSQFRTFEKSTTYKNIKLPLKKPRLVSPFPDPVKEMPSDTMSDQEKADLKEAEARCIKSDKMSINFSQCRHYSSSAKQDDKSKKLSKNKKQCPTQKSPCKAPAKEKTCNEEYAFKPCKKKEAPYQAYSEFCHTIPDEHPSACKICPWKPEEHPTFKTPKKKFHTCSINFFPRQRIHEKRQEKVDRRKGWVEQEKWKKDNSNLTELTYENAVNTIICKYSPCKEPKGKCNKPKDKNKSKSKKKKNKGSKKKQEGSKSKKEKKRKEKKKPKKKATTLDVNRSWVTLRNPESIQELPTLSNHRTISYYLGSKKKDKGKDKGRELEGPFKKFQVSDFDVRKPNFINDGTYPLEQSKQSAPLIRVHSSFEYLLDKPKSPGSDTGNCKKEKKKEDDPCGLKRKGKTKKCPDDLLKKKRRRPAKPKKRTAGMIKPLHITSTTKRYILPLTLKEPISSTSTDVYTSPLTVNEFMPSTSNHS